jgi:haloacetate dehalogenase
MFEGFRDRQIATDHGTIHARIGGSGPPLLLLHSFPQTHVMWRHVAPLLARDFTAVCADLRGYGESACVSAGEDHEAYSKRAMADELVSVMRQLGFDRFAVAGHDRGGRVAYRMALDHPALVISLAVLDIIPNAEAWELADSRLALAFWPWSLLAQPAPLPERLIAGAPEAVIEDAVVQWGSSPDCFPPDVREAYAAQLRDPDRVHAICEEFRSAATIDRRHDEADRRAGRMIECPTLALWDRQGALGQWYEEQGGPLAIWKRWARRVEGYAVNGGHFFPEQCPAETAGALREFFPRAG